MCLDVLSESVFVHCIHVWYSQSWQEIFSPLELQFQAVMRHTVSAWNWTRVFWKRILWSLALSPLCSPIKAILNWPLASSAVNMFHRCGFIHAVNDSRSFIIYPLNLSFIPWNTCELLDPVSSVQFPVLSECLLIRTWIISAFLLWVNLPSFKLSSHTDPYLYKSPFYA